MPYVNVVIFIKLKHETFVGFGFAKDAKHILITIGDLVKTDNVDILDSLWVWVLLCIYCISTI